MVWLLGVVRRVGVSGASFRNWRARECRERVECLCLYLRELSDSDNDGRLSVEEFAVAMHLIEKAKKGLSLPHTLPTELSPTSGRLLLTPHTHYFTNFSFFEHSNVFMRMQTLLTILWIFAFFEHSKFFSCACKHCGNKILKSWPTSWLAG